MSNRWRIGKTLQTKATEHWSDDQIAQSDEIENKMVFKNFSYRDEGRSRELICVCQTKEQAELVAGTHNDLLRRIANVE